MVKILEKIGDDLNNLAESTGDEASKLGGKVKTELKSLADAAKSTDVKKEINNIIAKVEKLVDETGDGAKKLLHEIKDDIIKLKEKV
jgi:ElaB/YqjD/DUF883 family membrane-anchored ribosome-binding protein